MLLRFVRVSPRRRYTQRRLLLISCKTARMHSNLGAAEKLESAAYSSSNT